MVFESFSYYFVVKNLENVSKEETYYVITYFRAQECIHYLYIFGFSAHVAKDNLLPTLKPAGAPYVIMASFRIKSPDLLNVVNKNQKLASCSA